MKPRCRLCMACEVFHASLSEIGRADLAALAPMFEDSPDEPPYVEFDPDELTDDECRAIVRAEALAAEYVARVHPPANCYGADGHPTCQVEEINA